MVLETDALDHSVGVCISQKGTDSRLHPVAYYSRKLTPAELNYDVYNKELLAIVEAFRQWRVYLKGTTFPVQVITDHKNLTYFTTTKVLNGRQVRWDESLTDYNFRIHYKKGSENARADALSRRADHKGNEEEASLPLFVVVKDGTLIHPLHLWAECSASFREERPSYEYFHEAVNDRDTWQPGKIKGMEIIDNYP